MDKQNSQPESGKLYIVASPIGNAQDITLRALQVLKEVDLVAAEDTRWTSRLMSQHNIKNRLISYHEHNETERSRVLVNKLKNGTCIALVSNAGTPSVSDPGFRIIQQAIAEGIAVIPIPGVSAAITALSASGLPTDSFLFTGFLSKKESKRKRQIELLAKEARTLILYESPLRILSLLKDLLDILGDRYAVLAREMTKPYEEFLRGSFSEILDDLNQRPTIKGEVTLLIEKKQKEDIQDLLETVRQELKIRMNTDDDTLSRIVKKTSAKYGLSKKRVYAEALKVKKTIETE